MIERRLLTAAMLGVAAGMWLMADPYYGIWHDSILYTVQALHRLRPDIYGRDLFFRFGSQDDFTLFPAVHSWLVGPLGIDRAALVLTLIGKLAWFVGLIFFLTGYLRGFPLWLGVAVVATYPALYDGNNALGYGESFATSRIFAEALTLMALGLVLRGRNRSAAVAALAALSLHPLMALPGMAAIALLARRIGKPIAVVSVIGAAATFLLAALGMEPFARLASRYDPAWLDIVEKRNTIVFLDNWHEAAFGRLAFLAAILFASYRIFTEEISGYLAGRLLLLGIGCLVATWLGAVVFHDVLLTQLQIWRGLWFVQVTALSLIGALTPKLWTERTADRLLLIGLWSALLLKGLPSGMLAMISVAIWLPSARYAPCWKPTRLVWALILLFPTGALVFTVMSWRLSAVVWHLLWDRPAWQVVLADPLPAALLIGGLAWLGRRAWGAPIVALTGAAVLVLGMVTWDGRRVSELSWDDPRAVAAAMPLQAIIPVGATVFWPRGLQATWFWLRRAHYASGYQTAGALFSRQTALLAADRQARLFALGFDDGDPYWDKWAEPSRRDDEKVNQSPGMKEATALCRDPELDYLVFPAAKDIVALASFIYPFGKVRFDLIDCRQLRPAGLEQGVTG
jgi:hypothetical protein